LREIVGLGVGIAAGVVVAALFAVAEGAFFELSAPREETLQEEGAGSSMAGLLQRVDRLQHGLALGHLLAVVWAVTLAWYAIDRGVQGAFGLAVWVGAVFIIGFIILVFSELLPKALGMEEPGRWAHRVSPVITVWQSILLPITALLSYVTHFTARLVGPPPVTEPLTSDEVRMIVAETSERAELEDGERELITSIFSFGETTVREVMTPRTDIFGLNIATPWGQIVESVGEAEHSRIPVYEETIDHIEGILFAKDLLGTVHAEASRPRRLVGLLREATFVPEAKKIDDLLREFQRHRIHLAVVVDEYGGTAGIVTLEDVLEELVGEIQDEYDREDPLVEPLADGSLRLDGRLDADDFNEFTGSRIEADGVETIGGLVARELGRIAVGGETITIDDWRFAVEEVKGKRITKVRAIRSAGEEGLGEL
jgi:CBS domain containing-hemolysin-like protein